MQLTIRLIPQFVSCLCTVQIARAQDLYATFWKNVRFAEKATAVPIKKWMLIAIVGVIVVVVVIGAYFLLSGIFKPPIDTSGINLSHTLTTEEVLSAQLANRPLDEETVYTRQRIGTIDGAEFTITQTSAEYDGIIVHIVKAGTELDASRTLDIFYDGYTGTGTKTKTSDWFTFEGSGTSVFFWKTGRWVFGIEASDSTTRDQAATELVQELRG